MSVDLGRASLDAPSTPRPVSDSPITPHKTATDAPPIPDGEMRARLDKVLMSDIGINTLLTRLKQSIGSAREFSGFLRERAALEEKHANGIQRLTRTTHELVGRPEHRQGSFAVNYRELGVIHDRMAKNSENFAHNLMAMSDELQEMAAHCERGRKSWKHTGLEAEQRAQDADSAMDKAKQKYWSVAEQYDRVRTGERQGGKFGLKGPKSAAQQEESLLSKAEYADQEYRSRVEAAEAQRHELLNTSRPQAIRELQSFIKECDAALSMQMQKFGVMNEKLLLGNGLCISPLKDQESEAASGPKSLREVAQAINNQKDFEEFVLSHSGKIGPASAEIRYEKHPALTPTSHQSSLPQNTFNNAPPQRTDTGFGSMSGPYNQGQYNQGQQNQGQYNQGQMSGVVPHQTPPQQNTFPGPTSATSTAPQLPQIGALSTGKRHSLEGGRSGPMNGRNDGDYRTFTGPTQQRPNQPLYPGPPGYSPGPTSNRDATKEYTPMGPGPAPSPGQNKGQPPLVAGSPTQGGLPPQTQYSHGNRGPSLGQSNDFRSDGRGPQQGLVDFRSEGRGPQQGPVDFRSEGRGPQQGPVDFRSDGRGPQQGPIDFRSEGRGPQQGPVDFRSDGRGPQQGPGYQTNQSDPRGLPSQSNNYGQPSHGGPATNISPIGAATNTGRGPPGRPNLPPSRPVFGVPLDELFRRDGAAVPAIVYQCVQAVDLFGLNTEGIYRVPGSAQHIVELQTLFNHDSSQVDFRKPAAFYNDIASVTTLLKQFLRDLPDPLLTSAEYNTFIQAAKIEEDIVRRDSLHAIINALPDPNYATLRTLILHLNRVHQKSAQNRMTSSNLAIVFGPTLMGGHGGGPSGEIQDAGWQARVVETILNNALQIFDDDD